MSLVREVGRLHSLAERVGVDKSESLEDAVDYVIGFNLKGLHKIEADLFFPWMREKLTAIQQRDLSDAFATVMDQLEGDRRMVAKLGNSIVGLLSHLILLFSRVMFSDNSSFLRSIRNEVLR